MSGDVAKERSPGEVGGTEELGRREGREEKMANRGEEEDRA